VDRGEADVLQVLPIRGVNRAISTPGVNTCDEKRGAVAKTVLKGKRKRKDALWARDWLSSLRQRISGGDNQSEFHGYNVRGQA